jgi:hypothetical protein
MAIPFERNPFWRSAKGTTPSAASAQSNQVI